MMKRTEMVSKYAAFKERWIRKHPPNDLNLNWRGWPAAWKCMWIGYQGGVRAGERNERLKRKGGG